MDADQSKVARQTFLMIERTLPSEEGGGPGRKTVGSDSTLENLVRRVWHLRERIEHPGIEFEDDNECIQHGVGRRE